MAAERSFRRQWNTLAPWAGLGLMLLSLVWLEWERNRWASPASAARATTLEPFGTVVLDAGHGGEDTGAKIEEVMEKELTLDVAQRVGRRLRDHGVRVVQTREKDAFISLAARAHVANREKRAIFVSIHFNEGGKRPAATGIETFYAERQAVEQPLFASWLPFLQPASLESGNPQSQSLAAFVQQALVRGTQAVDRGVKTEQFYVIRNVHHPAVLVEGGFISNKTEVQQLQDEKYREQMAAAITEGILRYREALPKGGATMAAMSRLPE